MGHRGATYWAHISITLVGVINWFAVYVFFFFFFSLLSKMLHHNVFTIFQLKFLEFYFNEIFLSINLFAIPNLKFWCKNFS